MPFLGKQPSRGLVGSADIDDNAVTLAKMAAGTDGNIISYDASGDPVAIATGDDGQALHSAGAGAPPAFESTSRSLAIYTDQEAAGSQAGDSHAINGWRTITLNTEVIDADGIGALSSNQITLGAGTYDVLCWFDTTGGNFNQHNTFSRFRDTTNSATKVVGTVTHQVGETGVATGQGGGVRVQGRFTLSGSAACEFQIYPVSYVTDNTTGTTNTGEVNVACIVQLEKV